MSYCENCGMPEVNEKWDFCPGCGERLVIVDHLFEPGEDVHLFVKNGKLKAKGQESGKIYTLVEA